MLRRLVLVEAVKQGARLFLAMAALSALFIVGSLALGAAIPSMATPLSQLGPLPNLSYAGYQISLHVVTGFAAGALSLDPVVAILGAATGPLIDLDHLGFYFGFPVEPRVAHSLLFIALLIAVQWRTGFWKRGTKDFALFVLLQYSVHFAVAPPGFPLLAPLSTIVVYFPRTYPIAFAAVFAALFFFDRGWARRKSASQA